MYLVLLSFVGLIAATFYTIRLTYKHFEPVMDKDYYEIGLNYENSIKDQKELMNQGFQLDLKIGNGDIILTKGIMPVVVSVKQNQNLSNADSIKLILERSATTKQTYNYELKKSSDGIYKTNIEIKDIGSWNTRVIAIIGGKTFEKQGIISIR